MAKEFTAVGKTDEVPEGEMRAYQVGGEDVAVANVSGSYHAFGDVCTHRQCQLSEGDLEGTIVTCPCHGSQFDVTTGDVKNGPATLPVDTYEVALEGDELRIGV
jgi:3-phenylpropionate/trans-cinnamate dioxygenase ferredoxin component